MRNAKGAAGRWVLLVGSLCLSSDGVVAQTRPLNDTGQLTCFDDDGDSFGSVTLQTPTPHPERPGQDCTIGRAAADALGRLAKQGGSRYPGRDQTKISNSGLPLPATADVGDGPDDWGCTRDNVTGLVWEAKSSTGGLRNIDWTYTWFDVDASRNGGVAGTSGAGASCGGTLPACTTTAYRDAVNALPAGQRLCGANDWRLPSVHELSSLLVTEFLENERIESMYFRLRFASHHSAQTAVQAASDAWCIDFSDGSVSTTCAKSSARHVVLVRGQP